MQLVTEIPVRDQVVEVEEPGKDFELCLRQLGIPAELLQQVLRPRLRLNFRQLRPDAIGEEFPHPAINECGKRVEVAHTLTSFLLRQSAAESPCRTTRSAT